MVDANALGVDAAQEIEATMRRHPQVVVMAAEPSSLPVNWKNRNLMFHHLNQDYQLVGLAKVGWRDLLVYRRK
jgi:hypothetical protein